MLDTIKDYLVSIGFDVNTNTLSQAKQAMDQMDNVVKRFATGAVAQFAIAGAAITSFVFAANVALGEFLSRLARTDLQMDMLARQMWTSKENATAFKNSLDAMGVSMQDLYLSPELLRNFMALRQQSFQMVPPAEYAEQMKGIRSIMFEFQRLKLEATYALQWIGYYLIKYIEKPLAQLKLGFKSFNDELVKSMPSWTKNIAQVLSWIVRLGLAAWEIRKAILAIGAAFMGFRLISLLSSPIGLMIAGMLALLLLIDDYNTYMSKDANGNHGEALFGGVWEELGKFKDTDIFKDITSSAKDFAKSIIDLIKALAELFKTVDAKTVKAFVEGLVDGFKIILGVVNSLIDAITTVIKLIGDFNNHDMKSFKKDSGIFNVFDSWKNFQDSGGFSALGNALFGSKQSTTSTSNDITQNFNVYGNDPDATAKAVYREADYGIWLRNLQGGR